MKPIYLDITDFGADPNAVDNSAAVQAAIDTAYSRQIARVRVGPASRPYTCRQPIRLPGRILLTGDGFESAAPGKSNSWLDFQEGAGRQACVEVTGSFAGLEGVHLRTNPTYQHLVVNRGHTRFLARQAYFQGSPALSAILLEGDTLTRIEACEFSLDDQAAGVIAHLAGTNPATNWLIMEKNSVYTFGPGFVGSGNLLLAGNNFERPVVVEGAAKIVIDDDDDTTSFVRIRENYFEPEDAEATQRAVLIKKATVGAVEGNLFSLHNSSPGSIAVEVAAGAYLQGTISGNHFIRWETAIKPLTSGRGALSVHDNTFANGVTKRVGGVLNPKSVPGDSDQGGYRVQLERFSHHQGGSAGGPFAHWQKDKPEHWGRIHLERSERWILALPKTVELEVVDQNSFAGVELTVYFKTEGILRHDPVEAFRLAAETDVTVPVGTLLRFMVVPVENSRNEVVEIGDTTQRLL